MDDHFTEDKINDAFTVLNKTGNVTRHPRLRDLEPLADSIYAAHDGEVLFDVYFTDEGVRAITFTEIFSQALLVNPCNDDLRFSLACDALNDDDPSVLSEKVLSVGRLDKYQLIPDRTRDKVEAVIFLPGTNFINSVDWAKIRRLVADGAYIKPHPITQGGWLLELEKRFPRKILNKRKSGFDYMSTATKVYTTYHSEIGLIGIMMDKDVGIVSQPHGPKRAIYHQIYDAIGREWDQKKALEKIMGSRRGGFFWKWQPKERAQEIVDAILEAAK